jgi:hypothetical protein
VTFPKPKFGSIFPNRKRIVVVVVKRTPSAFLCVLGESESLHQFRKWQPLLRFGDSGIHWPLPDFWTIGREARPENAPLGDIKYRATRLRARHGSMFSSYTFR